jgi:hypothetical protein
LIPQSTLIHFQAILNARQADDISSIRASQ